MKKSPFKSNCHYDYKNKCDCSEDDKCGCDYPNNLKHGYSNDCFEKKSYPNNEEEIIFIKEQEEDFNIHTHDDEWKTTIPHIS